MFCYKCGAQMGDGYKFCPKCGALTHPEVTNVASATVPAKKGAKGAKAAPQPVAPVMMRPVPQQVMQPMPVAPPRPSVDVKNIIRKPPAVVSPPEMIDFKGAEDALDREGLKTRAFSGVFSSAKPEEVRVDSLVKYYEPVHVVRATYEGTFEVMKDFTLSLDSGTTKILLDGKNYDVTPVATGGTFGGGASSIKLTGMETIVKRNEKASCYDMNGVQKNQIDNYVKGKVMQPFNPAKPMPRTTVLNTAFSAANLVDRVMTPDLVQRQMNAKRIVDEKVTVDIQTIYYPKYKAVLTNLKNNTQKALIFSAVDKQVLGTETF